MEVVGIGNLQSAMMLQAQAAFEQAASKLSLAEMQMVELRAQRLEGLQVHAAAVARQVFAAHLTKESSCPGPGGAGGVCQRETHLPAFSITCCLHSLQCCQTQQVAAAIG